MENNLTNEILELLKKHKKSKPQTEMEVAAAEYFNDEKLEELAAGLTKMIKQSSIYQDGE